MIHLGTCFREASARMRNLRCPKASDRMDEAEESVLCYLSFPVPHAKKIRTDYARERANRETRRRTDVVQCFPGRVSPPGLVG